MKVALFHELTPLSGARKVVTEYGKILSKDHVVDLYYVDGKEDLSEKQIFNEAHFFQFRSSKQRLYRDSIELIKLFFLHRKIAKIIRANNYDLVLISPSRYTQAPFLLGLLKKSVYFCQEPLRLVYDPLMAIPTNINFFKKSYEVINRGVRKLIDANNIHDASLVLSNSEFSKENIYKAYGINAKVCYLGVDIQKYSPKKVKKIYDMLFICSKSAIEGYDLLRETLKLFKKKPLVGYITRDEFGMGVSEEELVENINQSKIVLALSKNEPFGLVPIEAMACEVPLIAVSEGGLKESVVDGITGYLIKRDKFALKEKIDLLLKNDILRNKMGKNARDLVLEKFTWDKSVERFLAIIKEAGYNFK